MSSPVTLTLARLTALVFLAPLALGCGSERAAPIGLAPAMVEAPSKPGAPQQWAVSPDPQRAGDRARGRDALLNNNYIGCGVPDSVLSRLGSFRATPLPGRAKGNADLPYFLTRFTNGEGVSTVTANCLGCHAAWMQGRLVVGLGATTEDFGIDPRMPMAVLSRMVSDPAARRELDKLRQRLGALYPSILMPSVGTNPGDHIAAALFAHRDRETLAWSDEPLMKEPSHAPAAVDVPAWWLMRKKNAMFYTAAGRGDHARIMMSASALCTDSVADARAIDRYFPDIRAYILSLEAPPYPFAIDAALAGKGRVLFERTCSRCHGTYDAANPEKETYPNLVISVDAVGTDRMLAVGTGQFATRFVDWFNESFYGEIARLEPQLGYIAPPLDGVWATAPYLHNASVPTLALMLESPKRPGRWMRTSLRSSDYDRENLGWNHAAIGAGGIKSLPVSVQRRVYDTTRPGHGNGGHTYGDGFTADERRAVLEYLKTL